MGNIIPENKFIPGSFFLKIYIYILYTKWIQYYIYNDQQLYLLQKYFICVITISINLKIIYNNNIIIILLLYVFFLKN